ncbi:MAG: PKD domain-containing protein [Bacteroidia bacterium]
MKKLAILFFVFFVNLLSHSAWAQVTGKIAYSDTFVQGVTYCPGNSQYNGWGDFRSKLDTTNFKLLSITMKGTFDVTGRTCNDSFIARRLAIRLKNPVAGTDLSIVCGSNTWVVAGLGACYSGGSCASSSDNVGVAADGQTGACNCATPSYQLRPIIGNGNWGGVNTVSCPGPSQRMTLEFTYRLYPNDAAVTGITNAILCSNPNQVMATIKNLGSKTLDSVRVNWELNGTAQGTFFLKSKILPGKDTALILKTGLNYTPYTKYSQKIWTSKPNGTNDDYTRNDTLIYMFNYTGSPNKPYARDTALCGSGINTIIGKPANSRDTLLWYNSKTSNTILGVGRFFKTPYLGPGIYKYFLGSAGQLRSSYIQTNFNGGNQQAGFMIDIKSIQNNSIDSIAINIGAPSGTPVNIETYYLNGSYIGNETNPAAWTLLTKSKVISKGTGIPTTVPVVFSVPSSKTIGLYVQTTSAPSYYLQYGNLSSSVTTDETLVITTGIGVGLNWGSTFTGRNGNIRLYYKIPICNSTRDSMLLTIKRKPIGAEIIKGNPFESPNSASKGTNLNPDIVAVGKELNYELQPPSGYSNSGFGTNWIVTDVRVINPSGKNVPNSDTGLRFPTPTSNGKMRFIPSQSLEDSLITIYTTLQDLLITKCDTTIQRKIYIAPTPKTNFNAANVCFGLPVQFKNLTKIKSGSTTYTWYFGNGDTSQLIDPVYLYPMHGHYNVRLLAKSNFGISKDTIIKIKVFEIPDVKFKVINACLGDSLNFINLTTISTGSISYSWDLGDGKFSNKENFKHKYLIPSSYIVSLEAKANGCVNSLSKKAHQFVRPSAAFTIKGNCSYNTINFENNSTITLGENFGSNWQFGDGTGNNNINPTHIYTTSGYKIVKYIATSQFGCTDSVTKIILINASPEASFINGPICNVKPVQFTNTSIEPSGVTTSYFWDFGDGGTSRGKSPQHNYLDLGIGTIKLIAIGNNGCSTSIQKSVNVLPQPIVNFEALDACTGTDVVFTNKTKGSGLINFKWKFGDGDSSNSFSPTKKYNVNVASTFNVTLIAKNIGGCMDAITLPVNIKETPTCGFTFKSSGTGGLEYTFSPSVINYPLYQWSFDGGGNYNSVSPRHRFEMDGKYRVTLFIKNAEGCHCIDSSQFVIVKHLGIDKLPKRIPFIISPNPNYGIFSIQIPSLVSNEIFNLEINNLSGQLVYSTSLLGNKEHSIFIPKISKGIYLLKITQTNGFRTQVKIVISQ